MAPITRTNVDDFVFCHLLTETAAVVGLDYWYLSTIDLNAIVPVGTTMEGLATSYHERFAEEYRRFCPSFFVQNQDFFAEMARFYCDGVFRGFSVSDLKRSTRTFKWLKHEITYGSKQRQYIRQWLSYLSGGVVTFTKDELDSPVDVTAEWRRRLIRDLGERLWAKVRNDELSSEGRRINASEVWRAEAAQPDFRFANANCVEPARTHRVTPSANGRESFEYYFYQLISGFRFLDFDPLLKKALPTMLATRSPVLVQSALRGQKELPPVPESPDLMFLN